MRKEVEAHVIPTVEQIPGSWTFISDLENLLQILVWCGGCLVWWMSSVVDVVQSRKKQEAGES